MKWNLYLGTLVLALGLSTQSFGFELLNRMLGASGGCDAACCDVGGGAGCGAAACDPGCGAANACCEPACGAANACCDPACGAANACCDAAPCCGKKRCGGLLSGLLAKHRAKKCGLLGGCDAGCCEPACGAASACCDPGCGAANGCDPACGAASACVIPAVALPTAATRLAVRLLRLAATTDAMDWAADVATSCSRVVCWAA